MRQVKAAIALISVAPSWFRNELLPTLLGDILLLFSRKMDFKKYIYIFEQIFIHIGFEMLKLGNVLFSRQSCYMWRNFLWLNLATHKFNLLGLHGNPKLLPEHTITSVKHGGGKVPYVDI